MKSFQLIQPATLLLFLLGAWCVPFPISAAEPEVPELRLSLRDAIQAAVDNNPSVRLFKERVLEAQGVAKSQRAPLLPNLSGDLSGTRRTFFGGTFGSGGQRIVGPFNLFDARGTLTQSLFNLSLIQKWRAAKAGIEVAELDAEVTRRDTMATVGLLYTDVLRAEESVKASQANLTLNQQLLDLARDRKSAGVATGLDVTRAQVQVENERQRLLVAENSKERAKLTLIRALGINFGVNLVLTDQLKLVEVEEQSSREALETARAQRVELEAQRRREKLATLTLSSVSSERLPSLSFSGDYGFLGNKVDRVDGSWTGGLSMSIPIYSGGQLGGRISEERSKVRQEQIRTKDVADQITLEVQDALLTISSTQKQVLVSEEGLKLSFKELKLSRERFAVGVANNVEVTNAQTSVARARDNVIEALSNFNAARINLARAQGRLDSFY